MPECWTDRDMENYIKANSFKAWMLAVRPKTLSAAAAPVLIAVALAFCDGKFQLVPALLALLFAWGMQISANFINDLLDYIKGTDSKDERIGPKRVCVEGWIDVRHMKAGIATAVTISSLIGLSLLLYAGYELIFIGLACILFAYLYSGGPYPLSYMGLGDILVLLFFGIVPVMATYHILAGNVTAEAATIAVSCGLIVDTILIMNNYRDYSGDMESNKKTLVVLLGGRPAGRSLFLWAGLAGALLPLYGLGKGYCYAALMPLLYIPLHVAVWRKMKTKSGRALNPVFGETSRNVVIFTLLQCAGFILDSYL